MKYMKYLICIILPFCFSCSKNKSKKKATPKVVITHPISKEPGLFGRTVNFKITEGECSILWVAGSQKDDSIYLKNKSNQTDEAICALNFKKQVGFHKMIFIEVFKKFKKEKLKYIYTSGFRQFSPDETWSLELAKRSLSSSDWTDYKRNYPNHKSQKSTNKILIELSNQNPSVYSELQGLFKGYGLDIKLIEVEKVFTPKLSAWKHNKLLTGIPRNTRIITDSGSMVFSVSHQN